jgi:type I restriction enzyme S subunit
MEVKTGYKQTEVGVIPEDWEAAHIGDVCSFSGGSQPPRSTFKFAPTPGYIRLIQIRDYKSDDFASYIPEPLARKRCTSEDIMIGRYGPPIFQILRGIEGAYNVALIKTTPTPKVDPEFFFSVLNQEPLFQLIEALSRRSSGQTGVEMPALKAYGLPLPPLPEQRAIATALSDVDGLLGGLDRLIAKKRDLKQAAMQQLLTGQTRLPGFHGDWEVKRLGGVATFYKGKGLPKSALSESGAEPCIHYGELFTRYPETIAEIFSRTDTSEGVFRSVANDVLMPTSDVTPRGLAKASCVRVDGVILGGDILVIRSDTNRVHGPFLSLVIRYEETQVLQLVTGSTVYHLYGSDMKNFTFSMPSLPEQTAIASVLTEMDGELAVLEQRREKTRALKQAMMQELLTGRTRLV